MGAAGSRRIWGSTQHVIRTALARARSKARDCSPSASPISVRRRWCGTRIQGGLTATPLCGDAPGPTKSAGTWYQYGQEAFESKTGLPVQLFFRTQLRWILDNVPGPSAPPGKAMAFRKGGQLAHLVAHRRAPRRSARNGCDQCEPHHATGSGWSIGKNSILRVLNIPRSMLPRIVPLHRQECLWGYTSKEGPLEDPVPVCAALGDQQAALVGQTCFEKGEAKKHLWHRVFSPHEHRSRCPCGPGTDSPLRWATGSTRKTPCTVWKAPWPWLGRSFNGCAITCGSSQKASEVETLARTVEGNRGSFLPRLHRALLPPIGVRMQEA